MSWWDSSAISGFASQALKKAQKGIDKVLDINEEGGPGGGGAGGIPAGAVHPEGKKPASKPDVSESENQEEGGEFFNAWLATTDKPAKSRPLSGGRRTLGARKTSSSSDSDNKPEPSLKPRSSSPSAFTSIQPHLAFSEAAVTQEKQPAIKDESLEISDSNRSEIPDPKPETTVETAKKRGPLKLGSKKPKKEEEVKAKEEDVVQNEDVETMEEKSVTERLEIKEGATESIPQVEEVKSVFDDAKESMLGADVSDSLKLTAEASDQSDWADMSLSLLTESHMSTGSNKSAEIVTVDMVQSEVIESEEKGNDDVVDGASEEVEKVGDDIREVDDARESVEVVQDSVDEGSQNVEEADTDTNVEESEAPAEVHVVMGGEVEDETFEENRSEEVEQVDDKVEEEVEDERNVSVSEDNVMEESHESGELSDSNRTITGDDVGGSVSSDEEGESSREHSSGTTEAKDTDSGRDRSSSIQSLTEPSSSPPQDQSPESLRSKMSASAEQKSGEMSSSGYVKNMLEEAMVESMKDTDSHADSSDLVRIESGQNSGHTSADEIETTTSSDIEIISHISTPTSGNGEYRLERPFDLSPLRHALSKSMTRRTSPPSSSGGHMRTDSGSSSLSFLSGNGHDLVSPPGMMRHPEPPTEMPAAVPELPLQEQKESSNNPYETDKLLKDGKMETIEEVTDPGELTKKLAEMAETLDAREKKVFELSKTNVEVQESVSVLKNLLKDAEEAREADQTDLHALTEEFTKRIAEAEKRGHQAQKEKDAMKKRATELEMEVRNRSDTSTATERIIKEKDEQINELLEEGEKLSKQQLQSNNIIKKLRSKEKENDSTIKSQREKVDSQKAEIERLQKILDNKCDIEQKQIDAINQLNNMVKKQEKEIDRVKTDLEDSSEKYRGAQNALDSSYKEISDLHKAAAAAQSEQTQAALSAEMQAKQQVQMQLDQLQVQMRQEQEALINQIEDLRLSVSRQEKEHGRREDVLRQEISDLQQRLQEAEERNQELTHSVSGTTRPLLRQIENLQSTYSAQSASYEKIEKSLTDRLGDCQQQLAVAVEREREASEKVMDLNARLSSLESQCSILRQEKSKNLAQLEMERSKLHGIEDARNNEVAQLETAKHEMEREFAETRKEKHMLENQLEMERMKVEAERKRLMMAHEQLREKELQLSQLPATSDPMTSSAIVPSDPMMTSLTSMNSSMSGSLNASQEEALERALMLGITSPNGSNIVASKLNLYDSLRQSGAATVLENLQSQLKQKEGEVIHLQSEISELENTRESMAKELVILSNQNDALEEQLKDYPAFKKEYSDLDKRYQAMLQMYGEKVEEADELRLDLQDVKDMYKGQIEELLKTKLS